MEDVLFAAKKLRTTLAGVALTGLALATTQGLAVAGPVSSDSAQGGKAEGASPVAKIMDDTARSLALSLADTTWRGEAASAVADGRQTGLSDLADASNTAAAAGLAAKADKADRAVAQAKGLGSDVGSLIQVSLAGQHLDTAAATGAWVAAPPSDDDAATVVAYDSNGTAHELSMDQAPERPVFVVDVDSDKAVAAGLKVLKKELAARGVNSPASYAKSAPSSATADSTADSAAGSTARSMTVNAAAVTGGYWTTRVTAVSLADDQETWIKGDAEIFSLVTGFGLDGNVRVDTVTMPYLNDAGTTYYPNQILVNWSLYKYDLADVVMYEDDGDTNYSELAKVLATALLTIFDQGAYIPLVDPLIDAMPESFWVDDPDYVDSWYTLATTTTGTRAGAAANGRMTFDRYYVSAL